MNRIDAESETLLPTLTSNGDAHSGFRDEKGLVAAYAVQGCGGESTLETRDDGTANAILTPNGGRGGIGVVAVAYPLLEVGARTGTSTDDPRAGIGIGAKDDPMFTLQSGKQHGVVQGYDCEVSDTLSVGANKTTGFKTEAVSVGMAVRRLTPTEAERLQGFPDGWTAITFKGKPATDGPRCRALGNSMAVPVMAWLLKRIRGAA